MKRPTPERIIGLVVLAASAFLAWHTFRFVVREFNGDQYYQLFAEFNSVAGLKDGASVELSGVDVGKVGEITLDPNSYEARVELRILKGITLYDDVTASIRTRGIIGDQYLSLTPGKSDKTIPEGGRITDTKPTVSFEEMISQHIQGKI